MLPQTKDKLDKALAKEMFGTIRWHMLDLQFEIISSKENISFYEKVVQEASSPENLTLAEDLLKLEKKILKSLLKKAQEW